MNARTVRSYNQKLQERYDLAVPPVMTELYYQWESPCFGGVEFFSLEEIVGGYLRWCGMLPRFVPFAMDSFERVYGFLARRGAPDPPILRYEKLPLGLEASGKPLWMGCYQPITSKFQSFLHWLLLVDRYEDDFEEESETTGPNRNDMAALAKLPHYQLNQTVVRNQQEFDSEMLRWDAQNVASLCRLGCVALGNSNPERALDFFYRASESAPWFGDCSYLAAEASFVQGDYERAARFWWHTIHTLFPFNTTSDNWDLGFEHPDGVIPLLAAQKLMDHAEYIEPALQADPLWMLAEEKLLRNLYARLNVGRFFQKYGEMADAEREYLNALSLARKRRELKSAYDALIKLYESQSQFNDAQICMDDYLRDG